MPSNASPRPVKLTQGGPVGTEAPGNMGQNGSAAPDDRQAVALAVSELDSVLERALRNHFVNCLASDDEHALFGRGGTFFDLGVKVRVGYGIGLYGPVTRGGLLAILRIREAMDASGPRIGFDAPEIAELCVQVALPSDRSDGAAPGPLAGHGVLPPRDAALTTLQNIVSAIASFLEGRSKARLRHLQRSARDLRVAQSALQAGRFPGLVRSRVVGTGLP